MPAIRALRLPHTPITFTWAASRACIGRHDLEPPLTIGFGSLSPKISRHSHSLALSSASPGHMQGFDMSLGRVNSVKDSRSGYTPGDIASIHRRGSAAASAAVESITEMAGYTHASIVVLLDALPFPIRTPSFVSDPSPRRPLHFTRGKRNEVRQAVDNCHPVSLSSRSVRCCAGGRTRKAWPDVAMKKCYNQ